MATTKNLEAKVRKTVKQEKKLESQVRGVKIKSGRLATELEWENSWTRRLILTLGIYVTLGVYSAAIGVRNPWVSALGPALTYAISTLSMPWAKKFWNRFIRKD